MKKRDNFLSEISKGMAKANDLTGEMSFFTVDQRPPARETNRYKSGYLLPHFTVLSFVDAETIALVTKVSETLDYEHGALLFSETPSKRGVLPHIHIPYTDHPTVTLAKVFYEDETPANFNFYAPVAPTGTVNVSPVLLKDKKSYPCLRDTLFIFDSSVTPHEVELPSPHTSVTGFFFFENVKNVDVALQLLKLPYEDVRTKTR